MSYSSYPTDRQNKFLINKMQKIAILFLILLYSNQAFSECNFRGIDFFPEQKEITINSMFIIQGYHISQSIISSFKNRPVYLISENNDSTELILQETLTSAQYITQAIFFPSKELKPQTTYYIKFSGQTEEETKLINNYQKNRTIYWTTTNKRTKNISDDNIKIKLKKTEVIPYGCGPSVNAIFKVHNEPTSKVWYKTEVICIETNSKETFYIKQYDGYLSVGHGMCNGAFSFQKSLHYQVKFTPINTNGQKLKISDWYYFDSPI